MTGGSARSARTWRARSATSSCGAPTGLSPTSSQWWSTTPTRASPHVVRGEDLADNTSRQILLQRALGLPTPAYLHTLLVRGPDGEKLSKQNGATPIDTGTPAAARRVLEAAAAVLGLPAAAGDRPADALAGWIPHWRSFYNSRP